MAEESDNFVLQLLRTMRAENSARFDEIEAELKDLRLTVAAHGRRFHALDERVDAIRAGAPAVWG